MGDGRFPAHGVWGKGHGVRFWGASNRKSAQFELLGALGLRLVYGLLVWFLVFGGSGGAWQCGRRLCYVKTPRRRV
jgi:hypothetical protein